MIDETPRKASSSIASIAARIAVAITLFTPAFVATSGQAQTGERQVPQTETRTTAAVGPVINLGDVERLAMQSNPTLAQAEAAIRAAQGRRRQAGMFPNPVVGYQGEEFAFRAFGDKSKHFFFIEQTIPLGGKRAKSGRVFEKEAVQAEAESSAQKQRVLNSVRMLYYEALGAQQRVDLRAELARIAREAVTTTAELMNVGQADRPDYFEAEIEAEQVELDLTKAQNDYEQLWHLLASIIGKPDLEPARLAGDLEAGLPALDQQTLMATLLRESPEIRSARAEVERAQAVLARAKAEKIPDLFVRGAIGYSNEALETRVGPPSGRSAPKPPSRSESPCPSSIATRAGLPPLKLSCRSPSARCRGSNYPSASAWRGRFAITTTPQAPSTATGR